MLEFLENIDDSAKLRYSIFRADWTIDGRCDTRINTVGCKVEDIYQILFYSSVHKQNGGMAQW